MTNMRLPLLHSEMEYNDRELLVYKIRSGIVTIRVEGKTIKVKPLSIDDYYQSCEVYSYEYDKALSCGIKTQDEMIEWMIDQELWSYHNEKEIKEIQRKIEDLKLSCFENRDNRTKVYTHKNMIQVLMLRLSDLNSEKHKYFSSTCEGVASTGKLMFIIENSTFCDGNLYNFKETSVDDVISEFNKFHNIDDSVIRYLARTEPWKTIWMTKSSNSSLFFTEPNIDLTNNQKSLLAWSQMYDNVHESMECPEKEVIEDDDMLDGWFISQSRKREKEKAKKDLDNAIQNTKIKNSQEVFKVVKSVDEYKKVDMSNTIHGKMIKKQREGLIKAKGSANQGEFADEKLRLANQSNKGFKERFGGNK